MTTLTDRYVEATLRRLPPRQRPDIDKELRASIADAIDDHIEAGGDSDAAERAALTTLGDPARLAAGYANSPLHLIGPALYLDYVRLLTSLLAIVLPIVAGVVGLVRVAEGASAGAVITTVLGATITAGVHICFWTTLLFVLIERRPAPRPAPAKPWTPAALPDPQPSRRARFGEVVGEAVVLVLAVTFTLISPRLRIQTDAAGDPIGVLSPWLWETGMVYVLSVLAIARLGLSVAKHYSRWNLPLAVARPVVDLACAAVILALYAADRFLNPAFVEAAGWPSSAMRWVGIGLGVALVVELVRAVVELVAGISTRSWAASDIGGLLRRSVDALPGPRRR
jgi:hypothetical protein